MPESKEIFPKGPSERSENVPEKISGMDKLAKRVERLEKEKLRSEKMAETIPEKDRGESDYRLLIEARRDGESYTKAKTYMDIAKLNNQIRSSDNNGPDVRKVGNPPSYELLA